MAGYTKLFSRILDSTIWREDDKTRILWITMLAMADQYGIVHCTIPGLADRARISLEECESSLERFQQPDKYSWSREEDGRRIQVVEGGWFLINHAKYRALMSYEEQKEKTRVRVQKWREKQSLQTVTGVTGNKCNDIAEAKAYSKSITSKRQSIKFHFSLPSLGEITSYCEDRGSKIDAQQFFDYYTANGWKVGRNNMKDWRAAVRTWERNHFKNGGDDGKPSKTETRVRKNREAILSGLGISHESGYGESISQNRDDASGNQGLAGLLEGSTPKTGR